MKKNFILLLLSVSVLSLSACGNSQKTDTEPEQQQVTQEEATYSDDYMTLGNYKGIKINKNIYKVSQEDVDSHIKQEIQNYAEYKAVDRAVQEGDYVTAHFTMTIDGEVYLDYSEDEYGFDTSLGEYGPEIDQKIIGSNKGDVLDFSVTYDASYQDSDLAGKTVDVHLEILTIEEVKIPTLTDDFVSENLEYETVEEYKASVPKLLEEEASTNSEDELKEAAIKAVSDASTFTETPEDLYEAYLASVMEQYEGYAEMYNMTLDEWYEFFGFTEADLEEEALKYTHRALIVEAIADLENLNISDEELEEGCAYYASENGYEDVDSFTEEYGEDSISSWLLEDKVLNFLVENAEITEVEAAYSDLYN